MVLKNINLYFCFFKYTMQIRNTFYSGLIALFILGLTSCGSGPKGTFEQQNVGADPDYSLDENWAALPWTEDNADRNPTGLEDGQKDAKADVFFLHPTMYFGEKEYDQWNPSIDNKKLNKKVDEVPTLFQASAFNKAGRVFAPRYRQAHLDSYTTKDKVNAKKAFDLAYRDVSAAFAYYMSHHNNGRPFIIASHSQGTTHASRLIEEFIDGKPLENKMVAAYLLGIPVDLDRYKSLKACESEYDVSCLVGWRTYKKGADPKRLEKEQGYRVLITNPLSWKTNTDFVGMDKHKGKILFDFDTVPELNSQDAQIYKNILWTNKPKFKGSILYRTKNYHQGDVNLFYVNIRENAYTRVNVFNKNQ